MSSIITLAGLSCRTPDGRLLFDGLDLAFARERTGLVGRNGAGKTTLLNLIAGLAAPAAGTISVKGRVGVLRQSVAPDPEATVADLLGVSADLERLDRIERGEGEAADLADADWLLPARLDAALAQVGLAGLDVARAAASLSGGEATRAALAGLLAREPDMLLLDEPTNNLDRDARRIVAEVLAGWRGGAVVVSHDRDLLRRMDRIVELSALGAGVYGGNYDLYVERRAQERAAARRDLDEAERAVAQASREAQRAREKKARRDGAGRRSAAKGGEPRILLGARAQRAEESGGKENRLAERRRTEAAEARAAAESRVERASSLVFDLPPTGLPPGRTLLALEEVSFGYGAGPDLVAGLSLRLTGPERVALAGPNGAGKTTVLKLAAGRLAPRRGRIVRAGGVAMLDQHAAILRPQDSLIDNFRRLHPAAADNLGRAALARFLFRAEAGDRRVGELSGGERLRAALACVLCGPAPPQLLILDEPTNHLDLESIEAVESALRGYDGALLAVSHDADFLEAVGVGRTVTLTGVRPAC